MITLKLFYCGFNSFSFTKHALLSITGNTSYFSVLQMIKESEQDAYIKL